MQVKLVFVLMLVRSVKEKKLYCETNWNLVVLLVVEYQHCVVEMAIGLGIHHLLVIRP